MTNPVNQEQCIQCLCEAVETAIGRKMQTPKDYNFLADEIFKKLHKSVSPTTLKRLWGYLSEPVIPRVSTLDIIAQFVGVDNWQAFCQQFEVDRSFGMDVDEQPTTNQEQPADQNSSKHTENLKQPSLENPGKPDQPLEKPVRKSFFTLGRMMIVVLALALVATLWFLYSQSQSVSDSKFIISKGQKFATYKDYLKLFGIKDTAFYWGRPIPNHHNISVWGPEYQHPRWHNYGNPDEMMPTITERWEPADADSSMIVMRNYDNYCHEVRINEVRLTFMKNLVDSGYVFLGIYRMDLEQSDTTHCVWERVADECDLRNLNALETFRNNSVFPAK